MTDDETGKNSEKCKMKTVSFQEITVTALRIIQKCISSNGMGILTKFVECPVVASTPLLSGVR